MSAVKLKVIKRPYNDLIHPQEGQPRKIHPLDLVLFDGNSSEVAGRDLASGLIKIVSNKQTGHNKLGHEISTPSHLGLVVTHALMPYVPQLKPGKFYVLESTFSHKISVGKKKIVDGPSDITTGDGKFGVQIRDLQQVVQTYNGVIYRGRTLANPWVMKKGETLEIVQARRNGIIQSFSVFYYRYQGKRYNFNPLHLGGIVFSPLRPLRNITEKGIRAGETVVGKKGKISDTAICSELVAEAFKSVGLLPADFNARDFLPVDVTGVDIDGAPRLICPTLYQLLPN